MYQFLQLHSVRRSSVQDITKQVQAIHDALVPTAISAHNSYVQAGTFRLDLQMAFHGRRSSQAVMSYEIGMFSRCSSKARVQYNPLYILWV